MTTAFRTDPSGNTGAISFKNTDLIQLATPGPALLGTPTAPTAAQGTNSAQVATTAFVNTAISNVIVSSPVASNATPIADAPTGAPGTSVSYSRSDHVHPQFAAASNTTPLPDAVSGSVGVSSNFARGDHVHPAAASSGPSPSNTTPLADSTVPTAGSSTNYSRGDHVHPQFTSASNSTPAASTAGGTAGSSSSFSRADHAHPAGAQSLAANGYATMPGGLIIQWGFSTFSSSGSAISFPIPFPSAVYSVVATAETTGAVEAAAVYNKSTSGFTGKTAGNLGCSWIATGR